MCIDCIRPTLAIPTSPSRICQSPSNKARKCTGMKLEETPLEAMKNRVQYKHQVSQYTYWTGPLIRVHYLTCHCPCLSYVIHVQPPSDTSLSHVPTPFPTEKGRRSRSNNESLASSPVGSPFSCPSPAQRVPSFRTQATVALPEHFVKILRFMLVKNSSTGHVHSPHLLYVPALFRTAVQVHVKQVGYCTPISSINAVIRVSIFMSVPPQPRSPWPFSE